MRKEECIEGGKIDWAAHVNDAYTVVNEVQELDDAVQVAVEFYEKHPNETLISHTLWLCYRKE